MRSFFFGYIFFFNLTAFGQNNIRHIPTVMTDKATSHTAYSFRPFFRSDRIQISFSRIYTDARPLVTVDPILGVDDSEFESGVYRCLEKQVDSLIQFYSKTNAGQTTPQAVFVGLKQFDGMLLESLCRPSAMIVTDTNIVMQVCYSSAAKSESEKCLYSEENDLQLAQRSYQESKKDRKAVFTSLKEKSEKLAKVLTERTKK